MLKRIREYREPNPRLFLLEKILLVAMAVGAVICFLAGASRVTEDYGQLQYVGTRIMTRDLSQEDYDEDSAVCEVTYRDGEDYLIVAYTYEAYEQLETQTITAYEYVTDNGTHLFFDHENPTQAEADRAYQTLTADQTMSIFNLGTSLCILVLSLGIMTAFSRAFSTYEKCWFLSIMVLATIVAVLFPEESANGVNGIVIMFLYLLDTFLNILCELLISKQSRYNFLVSVAVEITEIVMCLVLMYRFATMVTTLFFWLPIDILSYINWSKHKDEEADELTAVRRLKGWQEVLVILGIVVWTVVLGYFISGLNIQTDFLGGNRTLETIVTYLDACASAVGVANGLFIFFRMREQWIAWYICAALESIINILSGQYVLLVLKLGYFTNTTYGYIRWSRYISSHKEEKGSIL